MHTPRLSVSTFSQHSTTFALLLLLTVGAPGSAQAYCTLHACQDVSQTQADESDGKLEPKTCERDGICIVEGPQLSWQSHCLTFGVSGMNTSVLGLTPEEFHDIVAEAYQVWEAVECPAGGNPDVRVGSVGIVDGNGNFFCEPEPSSNVSVWSLVTRWTRDAAALGFTLVTRADAEILDGDVDLNLSKIEREYEGDYASVLRYIALHEAGHYLGLAHSSESSAVMFEFYDPDVPTAPVLTQDDIDGICKLYPPKNALQCSEPGYVQAGLDEQACEEAAEASDRNTTEPEPGCSVRAPGQRETSAWLTTGMLAALGILRKSARSTMARRRRRPRRAPSCHS